MSFDVIVQIFRSCGYVFEGEVAASKTLAPTNVKETLTKADQWVDMLLRKCMKDFNFASLNQYTVACAIISTVRIKCKIVEIASEKVWPPELQKLSGLQYEHFMDITDKICESLDHQSNFKAKRISRTRLNSKGPTYLSTRKPSNAEIRAVTSSITDLQSHLTTATTK